MIVDDHGEREEYHRGEVERVRGNAARQQSRDLIIGSDARRDVAGVALGEELDRQGQHLPEKAADHHHRELGL